MTNEPSEQEAAARRYDARHPDETAETVAFFTSGSQAAAGSLEANVQQLTNAGVPPETVLAALRGKAAKAAESGKGNSR